MSGPFTTKQLTLPASHVREYPRGLAQSQNDVLFLSVNQYTPKDNPSPQSGDVTIIGGHANGFPKELYEPLWEELYYRLKKQNVRIRSILIADAAWQGKSGVLNGPKLGNDPGWLDYARDILQVINITRPPRPIIGVGHSFGANSLTNVSILHPRLFSTLILIDPVISNFAIALPSEPSSSSSLASSKPAKTSGNADFNPALASVRRRDVWPSRQAAADSFSRSAFYKTWDKRVLDLWVQHGLRDLDPQERPGEVKPKEPSSSSSTPPRVTLSTTKHQEVFTFLRPSWPAYDSSGKEMINPHLAPDLDNSLNSSHRTFPLYRPEGPSTMRNLPHVRPPVLYIFAADSYLSVPAMREEKMRVTGTGVGGSGGAAKGLVDQVVLAGMGHLVPMEDPALCARSADGWIAETLENWRREERVYEEWTSKSLEDKSQVSEDYKARLKEFALPAPSKSKL